MKVSGKPRIGVTQPDWVGFWYLAVCYQCCKPWYWYCSRSLVQLEFYESGCQRRAMVTGSRGVEKKCTGVYIVIPLYFSHLSYSASLL